MVKTRRNVKRCKKRYKKSNTRRKNIKGGGDYNEVNNKLKEIKDKYKKLEDIINEKRKKENKKKLNIADNLGWLVYTIYNNHIYYNDFDSFYEKLKCKNRVEDICNTCDTSYPTSYLSNGGQYKIYKIYISISYILVYYITHIHEFSTQKGLDLITGNNVFKKYAICFFSSIGCSSYLPNEMIKKIHKIGTDNKFNVEYDTEIDALILKFIHETGKTAKLVVGLLTSNVEQIRELFNHNKYEEIKDKKITCPNE